VKASQEEDVAKVERFASLWDRLLNLYLNREEFEEVTAARESEFLALQGSIMQELAAVAELEEGRLALVEEVTSVINEAISFRHLKNQSEFQIRRRKERGKQVAGLIANVRRFVAEMDSAARRKEKELETRLARPFLDPEKGRFAVILGRIVSHPSRFFSAIRVAGEAHKANSFLLALLFLLSTGCVITVTAFNASVARDISYNLALESGILTSAESTAAKAVVWLLVAVGVTIVSLAAAIAAAILAHLLAILMHVGFKIVGGRNDTIASHKVVVFGLAPLLLLVILPVVAHFAQKGAVPSLTLLVLPAATVCYIAFLHVIGFSKVHHPSVMAGVGGWLIGAFLFVAAVFVGMLIWHASVNGLPPSSGTYVYVTAKETRMVGQNQGIHTLYKGEILELLGEKGTFYNIRHGKDEGRIKKSDSQLRQGSIWSLPKFLLESSATRAEILIHRLTRKIGKEAESSS